jgi:hypothetical protein
MPPPSLLTRTIVADRSWSFAATSALRSWRNDRSPTTSATGAAATAADPSIVDTTPSIPFAPRFERTVITIVPRPSDAPYTAAANPAGPAPTMTVSYSAASGSVWTSSSSATRRSCGRTTVLPLTIRRAG